MKARRPEPRRSPKLRTEIEGFDLIAERRPAREAGPRSSPGPPAAPRRSSPRSSSPRASSRPASRASSSRSRRRPTTSAGTCSASAGTSPTGRREGKWAFVDASPEPGEPLRRRRRLRPRRPAGPDRARRQEGRRPPRRRSTRSAASSRSSPTGRDPPRAVPHRRGAEGPGRHGA